jgi:chromosome segregation ATPase
MQASRMVPAVFAAVAVGATDTNPLAKVLDLMDECTAKVKADGEAEAKAYKEYFEWCDDVAKNTQFEIKTAKASVEKLTASIAKLTSDIEVGTSKIGDLAAAIATNDADLKEANSVREKEAADFTAAEAELADGVDTLGRAIGIIERESAKNPAAFAQIDTSNMQKLTQAIGAVVDAAAFTGNDKQKLMALVQNQASDDDDDESGAPAPDAYKSHSGGILDVLGDMKDKAEADLSELRKAETNAKQNFNMLKGSLEGEIAADTKDKKEETNDKSAAEEEKSVAEGDLSQTSKDLSAAEADLAKATHGCLTAAADHEATVAARQEELTVIAEAKKILQETTSGAVGQSYSLLQLGSQLRTHSDLIRSEVVTAVRRLAKQQHSSALAQLSSKIEAAMQYGSVVGRMCSPKLRV